MHDTPHLSAVAVQICLFLLATSLIVPLFRRFGVSSVVAFLGIGLLLGPEGLGRLEASFPDIGPYVFAHSSETEWLGELGVVFLLFAIGLEVSTERLWSLRRLVLGLGGAQVALTAVVIAGVAWAFGNSWPVVVVTGLAFALSSTAVVLQILGEQRQLSGAVGRTSFSVLLLQDLAVVPILFVVAALGAPAPEAGGARGQDILWAIVQAALAIAAILALGRFLMRPLLKSAAAVRSREVFVATALLTALGAALIAQAAGLSMALGAFLAGLLLAETEFRYEIETDIEPFKGLLLGLFFATVGMQIDLALVLSEPVRVILAVVGLILIKAAILAPLARAFGLSWPKAIEVSLLLAQAGEFAFVVIALATETGIYSEEVSAFMLAVVALSLLVTPTVAALGARLAHHLAARLGEQPSVDVPSDESGHVIVAGYGRVGQLLGAVLQGQGFAHVGVDTEPTLVGRLRNKGWPVHVGDMSRTDVMAQFGAERAAAIIVTMDDFAATEKIVTAIKAAWPQVPVFARARDTTQARRLHELGCHHATPDAIEGALLLSGAVLEQLGIPDESTRRILDDWRREASYEET